MTMTRKQQLQANNAAVQAAIQKMNNIHMKRVDVLYDELPYEFAAGCAVILNDEIHIMGGTKLTRKEHYKWTGIQWESVSTLPYEFYYGCACVYNNQIHIMGGYGNHTGHYSYDGQQWNLVSTTPTDMMAGCCVVVGNAIHIFANTDHYKWNGVSWEKVSTLDPTFNYASVVAIDNDIYLLGGNQSPTLFRKWNGSTWTTLATLPYQFYYGCAEAVDGVIHIYGGFDTTGYKKHCTYSGGSNWKNETPLRMELTTGASVIVGGNVRILGGNKNPKMNYSPQIIIYT